MSSHGCAEQLRAQDRPASACRSRPSRRRSPACRCAAARTGPCEMRPGCCCHWPPRSRSAKGSRMLGRNREIASTTCDDDDQRQERGQVHDQRLASARARPSPLQRVRPMTRSPADSNARRTSASRSLKMPLANRRPPGQSRRHSSSARSISTPAIRLATTRWNWRRLGQRQAALLRADELVEAVERGVGWRSSRPRGDRCPRRARTRPPSSAPRWPGCRSREPTSSTRASPSGDGRRPTPRCPPGTAASSGEGRCRRPCPGRG